MLTTHRQRPSSAVRTNSPGPTAFPQLSQSRLENQRRRTRHSSYAQRPSSAQRNQLRTPALRQPAGAEPRSARTRRSKTRRSHSTRQPGWRRPTAWAERPLSERVIALWRGYRVRQRLAYFMGCEIGGPGITWGKRRYFIPQALRCYASGQLARNPAIASDGCTYHLAALEASVRKHGHYSPATGEFINHRFIKNRWVETRIDQYRNSLSNATRTFDYSTEEKTFEDPILLDPFADPVVVSDGHTYERSSITGLLQESFTSPVTRETLRPHLLYPNHSITMALTPMEEFATSETAEAVEAVEALAAVQALEATENAAAVAAINAATAEQGSHNPAPPAEAASRLSSSTRFTALTRPASASTLPSI